MATAEERKVEKKKGAARTQNEVRDEWWSDDRIKSFLSLETNNEDHADFHILSKAYQGMVPEAFERFVHFFSETGRNIQEPNAYGQTILNIVSEHKNSDEFAKILKKFGA